MSGSYAFRLFAEVPVGDGEGIERALRADWNIAPWILVIGLVIATLLVVLLYLRERGGARLPARLFLASLRLGLILIVLLSLLGWILEQSRTDLPDLILLIDDSRSMAHADRYANEKLAVALRKRAKRVDLPDASRVNLAKSLLLGDRGRALQRLRKRYNLKVYRVGGSARSVALDDEGMLQSAIRSVQADDSASRLGKSLRDVLELQRGRPTAAVVMLTDGVTTDGKTIADAAPYARRKAIPLFLVGLGSDRTIKDLRLSDLAADDVVFVDDVMYFDARLTSFGYEGQDVEVRLREKGTQKTLATRRVRVGQDGRPQTVRLAHRPPEKGEFEFVVEVEQLDEESDSSNNQLARRVIVRDERIRVLLAQSYPSFEFRFLSALLGRLRQQSNLNTARSIELTVVLQQADQGFAIPGVEVRRVFPVRRDELFAFDVVILGDVDPSGWSQPTMQNIVDFVTKRGGGLVVSAGPRFVPRLFRDTPLETLLPVDVGSIRTPDQESVVDELFQVRPTELGLASPQMQLGDEPAGSQRIWDQLEGIYWMVEAADVKPGARVLAEHPTRTGPNGRKLPLICLQFVEAGKVVFHATDETYRWRARTGDKYFGQYWVQTIRYLSRAKLLGKNRTAEMHVDPQTARQGEAIYVRVNFLDDRLAPAEDDGVSVVVESATGHRTSVRLRRDPTSRGVFSAPVTNLAEGEYRAWLATPSLDGPPPSARFQVVAPPGETARLEMDSATLKYAADITGGRFYNVESMDDLFDDLPKGRHERIGALPPVSLWGVWWVALIFAGVFIVLIAVEWLMRKKCGML